MTVNAMSHHMESSLSSTFIHLSPRASFPHLLHGALSQPHVYVVGVFCVFTLKGSILCEVQDGMWLLLVVHKMSFMFSDGQQRRVLTFSLIWKKEIKKKGSSVNLMNSMRWKENKWTWRIKKHEIFTMSDWSASYWCDVFKSLSVWQILQKWKRIIADTKVNIHIKEAGATRCKDDLSDRKDSLTGQSQNAMLLLQTHWFLD